MERKNETLFPMKLAVFSIFVLAVDQDVPQALPKKI